MTSPSTAEPEPTIGTSPRAREDAELLLRRLAPHEAQALARLAAGDDLRATARHLGVAPSTARNHLNRAIRKLGVRDREEALALLAALAPEAPRAPSPDAPSSPPAAEFVGPPRPDAPAPEPAAEPAPATFDEFAARVHTRLVQQTFLLTGHRHRAVHCVHLALGAAARRWAEVAADPDPEGRVRGAAFDLALSPWHRGGPRRAHLLRWPRRRIAVDAAGAPEPPEPPQKLTHRDRALVKALLRLSRPRRRALVLHDTLGLPVEQVAVEVESSTAAAAGRVRAARAALALEVPALVGADPEEPGFAERLAELLHRAAVHGCPGPRLPSTARLVADSRLHTGLVTGAAAALTAVVGGAIAATLLGVGPSGMVRPEPVRQTACTSAGSGSAGPAAPDGAPGLRTPWCGPTPGVPVRVAGGPVGPLPPPLAPAATADLPGPDALPPGPFAARRPLFAAPPPERRPLPPPLAGPCGPVEHCGPPRTP
ncbi:LuxR C-terminal-related transcriptional regulator [Kitasatospora cineracea]|uniref:DNA-binding CsgD family transcriptional regulator n=1 Tax=Kitasatospora cineracea TaxID=88074 RepID=A0A8G1ULV2_9ACTN|nr:LuxR C-terminal-related transcriptional regulator [Kitasatospora cineracea]ROR43989.1 DNA-binding CsgD family transcriptional regulator [Kitasatospora cineracea]